LTHSSLSRRPKVAPYGFDVDAILFDIDGTLVDSTSAVERAWRAWSVARGIDAVEVLRVGHGRRSEDTAAEFVPSEHCAAAVTSLERLELADLDDGIALPATRGLHARTVGPRRARRGDPRLRSDRWAAVTSGSQLLMRQRLAAAWLPVTVALLDPRAPCPRQGPGLAPRVVSQDPGLPKHGRRPAKVVLPGVEQVAGALDLPLV